MKNLFLTLAVLASTSVAYQLTAQSVASGNIYSASGETVAVYTLYHPTCFNTATGTVSFELMSDSYSVEWIDGSNNTTYKELYAGNYQFKILTPTSAIDSKVSLQQPDQLTGSITQIKNNNTYTLNLEVEGGVAPYTYSWNNGSESQNLNGLAKPGTYTVVISDKNNCTLTIQSKIKAMIKPNLDIKN